LAGTALDIPARAALLVLGAVAVAGLALDVARRGAHAPGPRRQVDENWLQTYRGWVYGAGFGVQLGAAFTTIVSSSVTYVAFAAALLCGSVVGGLLIGLVFGVARAVPVLFTARVHDPVALRAAMRRVDGALPRARVATTGAQTLAALAALAGAMLVAGGG
jgi:hypothetical protein